MPGSSDVDAHPAATARASPIKPAASGAEDALDALTAVLSTSNLAVVVTSAQPQAVDPRLREPGRVDRELTIGLPDAPTRRVVRVSRSRPSHRLQTREQASWLDFESSRLKIWTISSSGRHPLILSWPHMARRSVGRFGRRR